MTKELETEFSKKRLKEIGIFIFKKTAGERAITLLKAQKYNLRESSDVFSVNPECEIQNISHKLKYDRLQLNARNLLNNPFIRNILILIKAESLI